MPPSLRLPVALMARLLQDGRAASLYFDASAPHALKHEAGLYAELMRHPAQCIQVPSGRSADGEMLRRARASGGCILSRDHFRDHRRRYRKLIDDPARLIPGCVAEDHLLLPGLALRLPLPASAAEAWSQLQALLDARPG